MFLGATTGTPSGLIVDDDGIVFSDHSNGSIMRCEDHTCSDGPTMLVSGLSYPTDLAAWGDELYAIDSLNNRIIKASKLLPGPFEVLSAAETKSYGIQMPRIAADENYVYWSEPFAGGPDYVWQVPRVVPGNKEPLTPPLSFPAEIKLAGSDLLVGTLGGGVYRVSNGGQLSSLLSISDEVRGITADSSHYYWLESGAAPDFLNGSLHRCEQPDCINKELLVSDIADPLRIDIDDMGVYFGSLTGTIDAIAKP